MASQETTKFAMAISNLQHPDFVFYPESTSENGEVTGVLRDGVTGSIITKNAEGDIIRIPDHLLNEYGHDEAPCEKCAHPLSAGDNVVCYTCKYWTECIGDGSIIMDINGSRRVYGDVGNVPYPTPGQALGFGGRKWDLIPVAGGHILQTNNLYAGSEVPTCFHGDFPVTHSMFKGA